MTAINSRLSIQPLTDVIGAQISGVNLAECEDEISRELLTLLSTHLVLVFKHQYLDVESQLRLTKLLGEPIELPYIRPLPDNPYVIAVLKEADEIDGGVFGGDWHADFSFLAHPPLGSILNAIDIPPHGGDTLWSNQIVALDTLPRRLKNMLAGRHAIHTGKPYGVTHAPPQETRVGASITIIRNDPAADREQSHPVVWTDPVTGSRALNLNPIYTTRLEAMNEAQSEPVLSQLFAHATQDKFCYRHQWSEGDLVIWHNRLTLHRALNDYPGDRRLLYRTAFSSTRCATTCNAARGKKTR